ncbi:MAG: peptidoglycan-binding protein [Clostridia bacterium]|nr:peptidoglycan-binding protein [Clostridia bacterium]
MPSKKKRAKRRQNGSSALPALIAVLAVVAAALVVLLMQSDPLSTRQPVVTLPPEQQNFVDQRSATAAPLVLGADPVAQQTAAPQAQATATPVPEATLEPENGGNRLIPAPEAGDYFLPVFDKALRTPDDEMMIAITVDDCDDPLVLEAMVDIARKYDCQLTLFPTGDALMTEELMNGFKTCVRKYGYQLENHTYNHKGEYRLSDSELALQLWKQSVAASYVVGDDYQQHFFRPVYKGSDYDQRTHFFLRKLGYYGVASYTYSYKNLDIADLAATLENGNIYQFDMSEKSLALFEAFISTASSKGYRLVSMNELFGLGENEISSQLTIDQQTLPTMEDYTENLYDLKLNYRTHAVYRLQSRLMELGYLTGEDAKSDGLYGPNTSIAVSAFQAKVGIPATGNADVATQEALYAGDAPGA